LARIDIPDQVKMNRIGKNLVYEIGRYYPKTLPSIESTSKSMRKILTGDISPFHTLLEEVYDTSNVRHLTWNK
jgi:hypothetical protein